jgi:hypothetical protein
LVVLFLVYFPPFAIIDLPKRHGQITSHCSAVARKVSAFPNRSAIVKSVNPIRQAIAAIMPSARRPCRNRTKVGKAVGFFGVAVKS